MLFTPISNGDDSWTFSYETTETTTDNDITTVETYSYNFTATISETSAIFNRVEITSEQVGSADAYIHTSNNYYNYDVTGFYLAGEETGDKDFDEVWQEGNSVTFMLSRNKYERIVYEGATAPTTAPTVSTSTATGSSSGGTSGIDEWSWDIDETYNTEIYPIINFGDCFTFSDQLYTGAYRGLE